MTRRTTLLVLLCGAIQPQASASDFSSEGWGDTSNEHAEMGGDPPGLLVDLLWEPQSNYLNVGETFELRLMARADVRPFSSVTVALTWDEAKFGLLGVQNDGPFGFLFSGFLADCGGDGLNEPCGPPGTVPENDGDAFYVAISQPTAPAIAFPFGSHVTTFVFEALDVTDAETPPVVMEPILGVASETKVLGIQLGQEVTGDMDMIDLYICPSDPPDSDEDGVDDCRDLCPGTPPGTPPQLIDPQGCTCAQLVCDDGAECTDDACIDGLGCVFTVDNLNTCSDGDPCTLDTCSGGYCVGAAIECPESGEPCTEFECDPGGPDGNCNLEVVVEDGTQCDDENLCTQDDACDAGVCGGELVDCTFLDDDCSVGVCATDTGDCFAQAANENDPCDDGLFCTIGELCSAGICGGGVGNPCDDGLDCTDDTCDEDANSCGHTPLDELCDNGLFCDGVESCDSELGCLDGQDPCDDPALPFCDEVAQQCVQCLEIGDVDGSGNVDLEDWNSFIECETGPVGPTDPPAYPDSCRCLDTEDDGDIDLNDFSTFQSNFTGS